MREARAMVLGSDFLSTLGLALIPFAVVLATAALVTRGVDRRAGPVVGPGLLLGIGLGGFADGIVLHQILQWHNMLSSTTPPVDLVTMKYNMVWDGLFHALTWMVTVAGVVMLFRAGRRADVVWSGRVLAGAMLAGWGLFNLVEGVIDHQIVGLHHVRPGDDQLAWDLGFLASGLVLMAAGAALVRSRSRHAYSAG